MFTWMEKSRKLLLRAAEQFGQAQFHCGRPPPAALPRTWIRINPEFSESDNHVQSNRTRVAGALEKDRNGFHRWFDPPLFGSSHKCFIRWGAFYLSLCSTEIVERSSPILCRDERIYRRFTAQAEKLLDLRGVMRNQGGSPLFEIVLVLVHFSHAAHIIVNANHGIM